MKWIGRPSPSVWVHGTPRRGIPRWGLIAAPAFEAIELGGVNANRLIEVAAAADASCTAAADEAAMGTLLLLGGHHPQIQQALIHVETEPRVQPVPAHIPLMAIVRVLLMTATSMPRGSLMQGAAVQRT